jgi:hypothetical protein
MVEAQERVWFARDVIRLLLKAVKMRAFYGTTHVHAAAARDEVRGALRAFLRLHEKLRLEVRRDAFLVGDERVYEDQNRDANLAVALFSAGVREISFHGEPSDAELEKFLAILAARGEDRDAAMLLWEAELEHIDAICLDELSEGWQAPENLSLSAQRRIVEMNLRAEQIVRDLRARCALGSGSVAYEVSDTGRELERVGRMPAGLDDDDEEEPGDLFRVPEDQVQELRDEVESQASDEVVRQLVETALDGVVLAPSAIGEDTARWFLGEALLAALRTGNLELLATLLERYERELRARWPADLAVVRARVGAALEPAIARLHEDDGLRILATLGAGTSVGGPRAFCRAARALGKAGIAAAVSAYLKTTSRETREALNVFIAENAQVAPEELVRLVGPGSDAETARWALFLAGKHLRGVLAETLYSTAQAHADEKVRDYAAFLWRTSTPEGRLRAFQDALDAPDVAERVRAAETIAKSGDKNAYETLKKLIDEPAFLARSAEEKRAFLAAVVAIGGTQAKDFLRRQTERPTGVFRRRAGAEVREEAEKLLRNLTTPVQRPAPPAGGAP